MRSCGDGRLALCGDEGLRFQAPALAPVNAGGERSYIEELLPEREYLWMCLRLSRLRSSTPGSTRLEQRLEIGAGLD
jgi:hypothetical protein